MSETPIQSEIDLSAPGKQTGYLRLPHSVHRSAYGHLPIPIACIANGDGPTVLLMSGNHGDEYEGQVILSTMIRELEPAEVNGRVIVLPMANFPAALSGLRTSPIDEGNLNRTFPGSPTGNPTEVIADYIENTLLEEADFLFDLHSGGSSLLYVPTVLAAKYDDDPDEALKREMMEGFGLPNGLWFERPESGGYSSAAAYRKGVCSLTTELGGAGTVNRAYTQAAKAGLERALVRAGILDIRVEPAPVKPRIHATDDLIYAHEIGLYEPLAEPGDAVRAGETAALIHFPETPGKTRRKSISTMPARSCASGSPPGLCAGTACSTSAWSSAAAGAAAPSHPDHQLPVFSIDVQGSAGARASPR